MNSKETKDKVDELLKNLYKNKVERSKLEKEYNNCRDKLIKIMEVLNTGNLVSSRYGLSSTLKTVPRETVSKKVLPCDVWDKYKKTSLSTILYIKKV